MLTLSTPLNFAAPLTSAQMASVLCLSQSIFTNDLTDPTALKLASAQVNLVAGNIVNGTLQQIGGTINLALNAAQCAAVIAAQEILLTTIEQIVMQVVETEFNVTGTIS